MFSRRLDVNTGIGYHTERPPLEKMSCFLLIRGLSFLLLLVACLLQARCASRGKNRFLVNFLHHYWFIGQISG
jgi:hypothetical protein